MGYTYAEGSTQRFCPLKGFRKEHTHEVACNSNCQFYRRGDCLIAMTLEVYIDNNKHDWEGEILPPGF